MTTAKKEYKVTKKDVEDLIDGIMKLQPYVRHQHGCDAPNSRPGVIIMCNCDVQKVVSELGAIVLPLAKKIGKKI